MPDYALVAATSHWPQPVPQLGTGRASPRRTLVAAGVFLLAAAIGFGFDVLKSPERFAPAAIVFAAEVVLCGITSLLAVVAPRWIRVVLSLTGPLLALTIGIYHALVGAPLESCSVALSLYLAGGVLLLAGPTVQSLMALGAAAGYVCAASAAATAAIPAAYSAAVLAGVAVCSVLAALWQHRRQSGTRAQQEAYARMQAEHARATALLATATALDTTVHDFGALAAAAADHTRHLLDADWAVLWHRAGEDAYRVAGVSGLPPAIADTVRAQVLDPEQVAALHDRIVRQPALALSERDARRLLPLDTVAPLLKRALASAVRDQHRVVAILFAGYATRGKRMSADPEPLLAGIAERVGIAIGNARLVDNAQSANRAKSEFIATMSHELRTPINVVMGYADLLIEGAFGHATPDQLDVLNRVRHQSAQLLDLVQPMLDLNRLEARQTAVARDPFRIADLVEGLRETVPASWCKSGVSLSWHAAIGPEVMMHSDRAKVEAIIRNLIHNALKYTDHGEVTVRLDASATPAELRITVHDTGTGIAPSDMPVLFEMFGQSQSDLPRDGGVGLGLYIVKRLTDVLGGSVSVESRRGAGSTFTVILPLDAPAA